MDGKAGQASASADDDSRAEHALIGSGPIESLAGPESEPPGEHTPYETGCARSVSEASVPVDRDGEHASHSTSIISAPSSSAIAGPVMVNSAKAFASAFSNCQDGFKQVWEDGVWGQIFGDDDPMKLWGLQGPEAKRPFPPEGIPQRRSRESRDPGVKSLAHCSNPPFLGGRCRTGRRSAARSLLRRFIFGRRCSRDGVTWVEL